MRNFLLIAALMGLAMAAEKYGDLWSNAPLDDAAASPDNLQATLLLNRQPPATVATAATSEYSVADAPIDIVNILSAVVDDLAHETAANFSG